MSGKHYVFDENRSKQEAYSKDEVYPKRKRIDYISEEGLPDDFTATDFNVSLICNELGPDSNRFNHNYIFNLDETYSLGQRKEYRFVNITYEDERIVIRRAVISNTEGLTVTPILPNLPTGSLRHWWLSYIPNVQS